MLVTRIVSLWAGQSLPQQMFSEVSGVSPAPDRPGSIFMWNGSNWGTVTGDGAREYASLLNVMTGLPVYLIPTSVGGTALLQNNANPAGSYWLNTAPGSLVNNAITTALAALAALPPGAKIDRIEWWQGQQDIFANAYGDAFGPYHTGLGTLYGLFATGLVGKLQSDWRFCCWPVGLTISGSTQQTIRAQMAFATENGVAVEPGPATYDMQYIDGTHLTPESYRLAGDRGARNALASLQGIQWGCGPVIDQVWRNDIYIGLTFKIMAGKSLQPRSFWTNGDVNYVSGFHVWWDDYSRELFVRDARIIGNRVRLVLDEPTVNIVRVGYHHERTAGGIPVLDSNDTFIPDFGQAMLPFTPEMARSA